MYISNKAKFKQAVADAIRRAALIKDGTGNRRFRAIEKAAEEIRSNDSMQFDRITGQLSFVSATSGKPRRVTRFGCSSECDCLNSISYHQAAFEICDGYVRLLAPATTGAAAVPEAYEEYRNEFLRPQPSQSVLPMRGAVVRFPMKNNLFSTVLTRSEGGIETSLCRVCGETDSINAELARNVIADKSGRTAYRKHRSSVAARHAECGARTPHPQIAARLAKRVQEIEAENNREMREAFHYQAEETELFYENDGYREAA